MFCILDDTVRDSLGVGLVNCFTDTNPGIKPVVDLNWADLDAITTAVASHHIDIAWVFAHRDPEMSFLTFDTHNLGKGMDPDVFMALDIHHFWRENTHGTIVGRKRLVKLRHMAADGRFALNEVDDTAMVCEIQRSLNTGYTGPDDNNITHGYSPWQA
jgi:hypothetical protein